MSEEIPEDPFWSALQDATFEQLQQLPDAELLREAQSLGWDIEAWAEEIRASVAAGLGIEVQPAGGRLAPREPLADVPLLSAPSLSGQTYRTPLSADVSLSAHDGRAVLPRGPCRDWRSELAGIWPSWDEAIESARQRGDMDLPALSASVLSCDELGSSVRESSKWASMDHGLGDYARFALLAYLDVSGEDSPGFNPLTVARIPSYPKWLDYLSEASNGEVPLAVLDEFDRQAAQGVESIDGKKRTAQLEKFFAAKGRWEMFAAAVNAYARDHKHPERAAPLKGEELRRRRFCGAFAVTDFITYLNTGVVPARQAPFPDELSDLGISLSSGFVRDVVFLPSAERVDLLRCIVRRLVQPRAGAGPHTVIPITCLWSSLMPHGLVAMCQQMLAYYADFCTRQDCRRLPSIYVPVGLAAKTEYVSRRGVVRDLHKKLVVRRAQIRGETAPRVLQDNPTAEEVNAAIGEIRAELAREPALLIFGIHQVPPSDLGALQEEILDAPLPYIIHRLMPETGDLECLNDPQNAHATQVLILANDQLSTLAGLPAVSFELPECPAEQFGTLVEWTGASRVQALMPAPARDIVSSEVELSLLETALALQERSPSSGIGRQAIELVWGEDVAPAGEERVRKLTCAVLDHIIAEAAQHPSASWQLTLLHIIALMPGGVRLFTMARVMAGYVRAIAACGAHPRPAWCREAELWQARPGALSSGPADDALEQREHGALERAIQGQVVALKEHLLLRGFQSASKAGFDDYPHPYESPEVPPFKFNFRGSEGREQLEFVAPLVRDKLLEELRQRFPEKHSLLNRLLAEECIRRAAIVSTHRADVDHSSLIDKRYIILGLHHGLQSLQFGLRQLLSAYGRARCSWLIPHQTRLATYHWIYQWLYVEMLNGRDQELSRHHGAERVRRRLLEELLAFDPERGMHQQPERYRERSAIRHFEFRSQILHGLADVAVRRCATPDAQKALEQVRDLTQRVRATVQDPASQVPSTLFPVWRDCIEKVNRRTAKLMLDMTISRAASSLRHGSDGGWLNVHEVVNGAFVALEDSAPLRELDRCRVIGAVVRAIRECHHCGSPERWQVPLLRAAREIRKAVPERVMQPFYNCLVRYGELIVYTAEPIANEDARMRRRRSALIILEVAETLRSRYASTGGHVLAISARPARSAARMCLMLAWRDNSKWFQKRAGHYCFNVMGNRKQQGIDRISLLILRAMTIRLRGKPGELPLAMTVLKTAERALINYPDRVELWIRFYLERAKVFAARATQEGTAKQEARWCSGYCRCDVEAIIRLARDQEGDREGWVIRAQRILNRLPSPAPWDEESPRDVIPATAMRQSAAAGVRGRNNLVLIRR